MSDTELIAILMPELPIPEALELSSRSIAAAGSLAELARWQSADFTRIAGIGRQK